MARSRFVGDAGLTLRMTTVMFLLGALFVAFVVGVALAVGASQGYGISTVSYTHLTLPTNREV